MKKNLLFLNSESTTTQLLMSLILRETDVNICLVEKQSMPVRDIASEFNLFLETDRVHSVQFEMQNPLSIQKMLTWIDCLVFDVETFSWIQSLVQVSLPTGTDCLITGKNEVSFNWIQSISNEISRSGCRIFLCDPDEMIGFSNHEDPDMSYVIPIAGLIIEYLNASDIQPGVYQGIQAVNLINYQKTLQSLGLEPEAQHACC